MFNLRAYRQKRDGLLEEIAVLNARIRAKSTTDALEEEIRVLRDEIAKLERTHQSEMDKRANDQKVAEEDIKHMYRMKEERWELAKSKFELKCEQEKDREVADVKDVYRAKREDQLKEESEKIMGMYKEIMGRLPDIQVKLRGDVG